MIRQGARPLVAAAVASLIVLPGTEAFGQAIDDQDRDETTDGNTTLEKYT